MRRSDDTGLVDAMNAALVGLEEQARVEFESDGGIESARIRVREECEVRYVGQAYEVAVGLDGGAVDQAAV